MKNKLLILVIIGLLVFAGFSFASIANNDGQEEKSCSSCCCLACCKVMGVKGCEDIDLNVENVKDGVVVKVTSKNADVVKKIQEMYAKMKDMCSKEECCKKKELKVGIKIKT